ncbi:cytochrome C oxidase subunit IV family protein [Roseiflexus sp.]|uniref:cytochrome C oxidase subunit IV family protein n=1 Tax=Roseiflexus sp. TaxID=2562120 RepID=UPI00398AC067
MAGHHEEQSSYAHGEHSHSDRFYWLVAGVLAVVTALEVALFIVNEQHLIAKWLEVTLLLILSTIKGAAVVMFFMHLKGDAGIFKFVFLVPLAFATTLLLSFMVLFSGHVGIAG